MNIHKQVELLKSAAKELSRYIDAENNRLKQKILSTDLDDPDYHDHQTCAELYQLAIEIQCGIDYNQDTAKQNDEHALNQISIASLNKEQ